MNEQQFNMRFEEDEQNCTLQGTFMPALKAAHAFLDGPCQSRGILERFLDQCAVMATVVALLEAHRILDHKESVRPVVLGNLALNIIQAWETETALTTLFDELA